MKGKFNMNLTEKTKPTISFTDCYSMHNVNADDMCKANTRKIYR